LGYAFAHGPGNFFLGWRYFFSENMPAILYSHWLWHTTLAVTAASIATSSMNGRCEFLAYPVVTVLVTGENLSNLFHLGALSAYGHFASRNEQVQNGSECNP
jgi:hypothetical protein